MSRENNLFQKWSWRMNATRAFEHEYFRQKAPTAPHFNIFITFILMRIII